MKMLRAYCRDVNIPKLLFALTIITLASTEPSLAQDFAGVESFMRELVKAITGPIGVAISAMAIIAVGFSFMTGRMDWTFAVSIVLGIAIVFGAATFVTGIKASGVLPG